MICDFFCITIFDYNDVYVIHFLKKVIFIYIVNISIIININLIKSITI